MKPTPRCQARVREHAVLLLFLGVGLVAPFVHADPALNDLTAEDVACLACHDGLDARLASGPHELGRSSHRGTAAFTSCVSCHEGADAHSADPTAANISNPARLAENATRRVCTGCHLAHGDGGAGVGDPHAGAGIGCVSCHPIHPESASPGVAGALDPGGTSTMCGRCHPAIAMQFARASNHPLADGTVGCVSCHPITGPAEPSPGHGPAANCSGCHPDASGPFLHPHDAANSFSPDGGGCLACHLPHGSPNDRLLVQPGGTLCRQCHSVPPGHRTAHFAGLGVSYACIECHSEIHGSDWNRALLDPDLDSKIAGGRCYDAGCHPLD